MPSDSVSSFLDLARENRLLPLEQVDELIRQPDLAHNNLGEFCASLVSRGLLSDYQSQAIREGRGRELNFAGYVVVDRIGPCPGGTAYNVIHKNLRTKLILRRLRTDWLAPHDNLSAFVQRAQTAALVTHPNLATLFDAWAYEDEFGAVIEPFEGDSLESLVRDIGPMPTHLACEFARQVALALAAAHARGLSHGEIRPAVLHVGPLAETSRRRPDGSALRRPTTQARVKVFELGLVPRRATLTEWATAAVPPAPGLLAYQPAERLTHAEPTPAGDVASLAASLFFLLTGRPPIQGETTAEMVAKLSGERQQLSNLRVDVPPDLVTLIHEAMANTPESRPTAAGFAERLTRFTPGPGPPPATTPPAGESSILGKEPVVPRTTAAESASGILMASPADSGSLVPMASPADSTDALKVLLETTNPAPTRESTSEWYAVPHHDSTMDGELRFVPPPINIEESTLYREVEDSMMYVPNGTQVVPALQRRGMTDTEARGALKMWALVAGGLWILSIPLWYLLLSTYGCLGDSNATRAAPTETKSRRR